jgi:hypothetical protein
MDALQALIREDRAGRDEWASQLPADELAAHHERKRELTAGLKEPDPGVRLEGSTIYGAGTPAGSPRASLRAPTPVCSPSRDTSRRRLSAPTVTRST